jgi:hypothetical protein
VKKLMALKKVAGYPGVLFGRIQMCSAEPKWCEARASPAPHGRDNGEKNRSQSRNQNVLDYKQSKGVNNV